MSRGAITALKRAKGELGLANDELTRFFRRGKEFMSLLAKMIPSSAVLLAALAIAWAQGKKEQKPTAAETITASAARYSKGIAPAVMERMRRATARRQSP